VSSLLHDAAVFKDNDLIGVPHCAEAVSNHKCGAVRGDLQQRALDRSFGFVVNGGSRFIEHQDWRIFQDCACQGDALTLPTGQALSALPHQRVVTVR